MSDTPGSVEGDRIRATTRCVAPDTPAAFVSRFLAELAEPARRKAIAANLARACRPSASAPSPGAVKDEGPPGYHPGRALNVEHRASREEDPAGCRTALKRRDRTREQS